jgi:hypothetical protein
VTFSTGVKLVSSRAYCCPQTSCAGAEARFVSQQAETLHLKYRRLSRELVVKIGYRRFWHHQTMYEIYDWLNQDLQIAISACEVMHLIADFLALLKAAQGAKIRRKLRSLKGLLISLDGMQPEKGNDCLYLVRELQSGVTLLAVNLEESSREALCEHLLEPLEDLEASVLRCKKKKTTGRMSDAEDQRVAEHINQTFRSFWWGLFICYDVEGLPRTNNELERFNRQIKMGHRRVSGRKNVHDFNTRYGVYASLVKRHAFGQRNHPLPRHARKFGGSAKRTIRLRPKTPHTPPTPPKRLLLPHPPSRPRHCAEPRVGTACHSRKHPDVS